MRKKIKQLSRFIAKRWFRYHGWRGFIRSASRPVAARSIEDGRVFFDVSVICREDARTGIQRVVRSIIQMLLRAEHRLPRKIVFVREEKGHHYVVSMAGGHYDLTKELVEYEAGDVFVGLDYALDSIWRMRGKLSAMRARGVRVWYLVHDVLPFTRPEWFSKPTVLRFWNWLAVMAGTADGFFCVSSPVEQDLRLVLEESFGVKPPRTVVLPLGWEIPNVSLFGPLSAAVEKQLAIVRQAPALVIVATIEPRKGHADALAAFEHLWGMGHEYRLVLVGGRGWKTSELYERLAHHPELGHRLFLMGKVDDVVLERIYADCDGVLVPSLAEGFGLPVVEAIGRRKPVLARDIPVFSSHAGKGVSYFPVDVSCEDLAAAILSWFEAGAGACAVRPDLLSTWADTARVICATIEDVFRTCD